jgi:hypothetical protein
MLCSQLNRIDDGFSSYQLSIAFAQALNCTQVSLGYNFLQLSHTILILAIKLIEHFSSFFLFPSWDHVGFSICVCKNIERNLHSNTNLGMQGHGQQQQHVT